MVTFVGQISGHMHLLYAIQVADDTYDRHETRKRILRDLNKTIRQSSNAHANHHLSAATDVLLMKLEAEQTTIVE